MRFFSAATPARCVLAVLVALSALRGARCLRSPFASKETTDKFMSSLKDQLGQSLPLSDEESSQLDSISDEIGRSVQQMSQHPGKRGSRQLQEVNKAFARSMANFAVSNPAITNLTDQLAAAYTSFEAAAESLDGELGKNTKFVSEISDLIRMFSDTNAEDVA